MPRASDNQGEAPGRRLGALLEVLKVPAPLGTAEAVQGQHADGHRFVEAARERGAVAAVVEERAPDALPQVVVPDSRKALALLADEWFGRPADAMQVFGVTGTNGKTTTTFLLRAIARAGGLETAVLGTTGYSFPSGTVGAPHTTPEAPELWELLSRARDEGCGAVAMEVSSHALAQDRTYGLPFDAVAFMNLTRDHLDFHRDFEDYREAKMRLFRRSEGETWRKARVAAVNLDDPSGAVFASRSEAEVWTFSRTGPADVRSMNERLSAHGSRFGVASPAGSIEVELPLAGAYNISNALGAATLALRMGIAKEAVREGLRRAHGAPGRLEAVRRGQPFQVWVDYAHTPDALERALEATREITPGRLICVFGCGGDRDPGKRPQMGEAATRVADFTVVTSDNPRTEDPAAILEDIRPGLSADSSRWTLQVDRREAIRAALAAARGGDGVLIAGKGHEDYQIVGTEKRHFDDREVAAETLEWLGYRS